MSTNPKTRRAALIAAVNAYCDVMERAEQGDPRDPPAPVRPTRRRGPTPPEVRPELDDITKRALQKELQRHGLTTITRQRND